MIYTDCPRWKGHILGGQNISHSKQKIVCVLFQTVSETELFHHTVVDRQEILHTVSNVSIYCSSDKVGTVYLVHRQHQCTLQLVYDMTCCSSVQCTVYCTQK
jgi:hypothetical protein